MRQRGELFHLVMTREEFMSFSKSGFEVLMSVPLVPQVDELPSTPPDLIEICIDLLQIRPVERKIIWICPAVVLIQPSYNCWISEELWVITERAKASRKSTRFASKLEAKRGYRLRLSTTPPKTLSLS